MACLNLHVQWSLLFFQMQKPGFKLSVILKEGNSYIESICYVTIRRDIKSQGQLYIVWSFFVCVWKIFFSQSSAGQPHQPMQGELDNHNYAHHNRTLFSMVRRMLRSRVSIIDEII